MCIFIFIKSETCSLFTGNLSLIFFYLNLPYSIFLFIPTVLLFSFVAFFLIYDFFNYHSILPSISLLARNYFSLILVITLKITTESLKLLACTLN